MQWDTLTVYRELHPYFQGRIRQEEPLSRHNTFGVGGPADIWLSVKTLRELIDLVSLCSERQWPLLVVGNSTNSLYADAGVRGIVARIALASYEIEQTGDERALLLAEAGVLWPRLVYELAAQGWGGIEFGIGIPGTLGGALVSNAGAHNREIGEVVEWIEVLDARGVNQQEEQSYPMLVRYLQEELDLSYRSSQFRAHQQATFDERGRLFVTPRKLIEPEELVIRLALRLHRVASEQAHDLLVRYKREREHIEPGHPKLGLIFKEPRDISVDALAERVDMKGMIHGRARVAPQNANYLLNLGGARTEEMVALIEEMHSRVLKQTGINLELTLELLGEWNIFEG